MDKTFLVINEGTSSVAVSTRHESILIEGKQSYPFTQDEIRQINGNSNAFKIGLLFFEKECEEEMYSDLRIRNWKTILHNDQIEEMLMHPTADDVETILAIDSVAYFERVRGLCIMLKNTGKEVPTKIDSMVNARWRELSSGRLGTSISVKKSTPVATEDFEAYKADMEKKVADLLTVVENLSAEKGEAKTAPVEAEPEAVAKPVEKPDTEEKPKKPRSTTKSTKTTK